MPTPLKRHRIKLGLTTETVAAAVGVKPPTINRIENGRKRPSPELTIRISTHFGGDVTRDQIMFPEFYPENPKKPVRSARPQKA